LFHTRTGLWLCSPNPAWFKFASQSFLCLNLY
jgi:hypothetical protein